MAVPTAHPSIGRLAARKIGSANSRSARSRLRTSRSAMGPSDVLKACVDNPEPQAEADEHPHYRQGEGRPYEGADAGSSRRAERRRSHEHEPGHSGVAGRVHAGRGRSASGMASRANRLQTAAGVPPAGIEAYPTPELGSKLVTAVARARGRPADGTAAI